MAFIFNPNNKKGVFMIPSGATKSPTPTPSFTNKYSLNFDGVDDYLNCGDITTLDNASTFTYSGWYNQTTLNQEAFMFGSQVDATNYIGFYTWSDGNLYIDMKQGSIHYGYFDYSLYVTAGQWFHFAIVFDGLGATTSDKIKCYINGALITLTLPYSFPTSTPTGTNITGIGKMDAFSQTWNGNSDECSLFSTAKTGLEITDIYNLGTPTDLSALAGLTNWYRNGDNGTWKSPQWLIPENSNVANSRVSNYSFAFDGVDDSINCGDVLHNDGQTPMSLSAWVNITNTGDYAIASKKKVRGAPLYLMEGWDISIDTSGAQTNRLQFSYVGLDSGGSSIGYLSKKALTFSISDGLWHHVAVTYDGSESAIGVKFYIDGVEDTLTQTLQDTLSGNSPNDPTVDFKIATASQYGGSDFYDGNIDELAIWSATALTQEQITAIYNSGVPAKITGATSHYKMGENATYSSFASAWTVLDAVGSNHGTSANMTLEDRLGDAPNSTNNALSLNMDEVDRETDTP